MRTTAGSPPLVVRGRHLTDSVALHATQGHTKTLTVGNPTRILRVCDRVVRSTPACSLLGSDRASEHSSLTGRRGYALVSLSENPVCKPLEGIFRDFVFYADDDVVDTVRFEPTEVVLKPLEAGPIAEM